VSKDGALLEVVKYAYTKGQARQVGHVQVEYRDLRTGGSSREKLSPSDRLERAQLDAEVGDGAGPGSGKVSGCPRLMMGKRYVSL
jgi:translation elongation factor P/translation initiation factor 5A